MDSTTRDLTQTITELATPLAASLGLAIWGVEVIPAGRCVIRVYAESLEAFTQGQSIVAGCDDPETDDPETDDPRSPESSDSPASERPLDIPGALTLPAASGLADPAQTDSMPEEALRSEEDTHDPGQSGSVQDTQVQDDLEQDDIGRDDICQGGINIDQCADLSRLLGLTLEVEDCVESAYVLEVSSPGLNRVFFKPEQLQRAIGAKVEATLLKSLPGYPGRKKFIGTVSRVEGETCRLSVSEPEDVDVDIPWTAIKKIRQVYVMPEKKLPGKSPKNTRQKKSAAKKKK